MNGGLFTSPRTAEGLERIRGGPNDAWAAHGRDGTDARNGTGSDGWREATGGADYDRRSDEISLNEVEKIAI
jgi:hypothetical protein